MTSSQGSHLVLLLLSAGNVELDVGDLYGEVHEAPGGGGDGGGDHGAQQSRREYGENGEGSDGIEEVLPAINTRLDPLLSSPLPACLSPVLLAGLRAEEGGVSGGVVVVAVVVVGILRVAVVVQVVVRHSLRVLAGHWLGGRGHDVG